MLAELLAGTRLGYRFSLAIIFSTLVFLRCLKSIRNISHNIWNLSKSQQTFYIVLRGMAFSSHHALSLVPNLALLKQSPRLARTC